MGLYKDNLLAGIDDFDSGFKRDESNKMCIIQFLNNIEGWKTKCKNLHWSAKRKNIHVYLDEFLNVLNEYQDGLAEGFMGIDGKFEPDILKGNPCYSFDPYTFIVEVRVKTLEFYNKIPEEVIYKGIASECETFIQNINKYVYLFNLCKPEMI